MAATIELFRHTTRDRMIPISKPTLLSGEFVLVRLPSPIISDGKKIGAFVEVEGGLTRVGDFIPNEADPTKKSLRIRTFEKTQSPQPIDVSLLLDSGRQPQTITARITHVK